MPYGIYDITANAGWVNVGTDHDTAAFAVESVRRWWKAAGQEEYPQARRLLITADAGGSNGYRTRAWKAELAALAVETGLEITVCHFPPGTSKWNKVEHRLFSHITMNWRGRPLSSHEVVVNTIAATRHPHRAEGPCRAGRRRVPDRGRGQRRADEGAAAGPPRLARRLELHPPPAPARRLGARLPPRPGRAGLPAPPIRSTSPAPDWHGSATPR